MRSLSRFSVVASLCLSACLSGTDDSGNGGDAYFPPTANVAGTWTLTGRGSRSSCTETLLNGDFSLDGMVPLEVEQGRPADGSPLSLGAPVDVGSGVSFTFHGRVSGSHVTFSTTETGPDYLLTFSFDGEAEGALISGSFTGSGPSSCAADGTFDVVISGQVPDDDGARLDGGDPLPPADPHHADPLSAGDREVGDGHLVLDGDSLTDRLGLSCNCGASGAGTGLAWVVGLLLVGGGRRRR